MPYTVALTGGIGSGKSTVAQAFAHYGIDIIDADVIARQVVTPGRPALAAITARFGSPILHADGTLNRPALRQKIFSSPAEKAWLDRLLHPLIHAETRRQIAAARSPWCLWVVPLLVENRLEKLADRVLVVDVDPRVQIERTMVRDGITREQAENILAAQATRAARLAVADDIIENSGQPDEVLPLVAELHQRYLTLAAATEQD
jgi:dephospho-CoA kinase